MFNFNWWKRSNKKDKEWERFRNWYQMHRLAEQFTWMKCHFCQTPAPHRQANYCSHCGARFHTEPELHTTTEPLPVELPSEILRRQLQEQRQTRQLQQQQDTADVPTQKFRTVRLERIV
jgi:hypothetical protein